MRKIIFMLALFAIHAASALPTLENLAVSPQNAYLGENIEVSFTCSGDASIMITGPGVIIPDIRPDNGPQYSTTLDRAFIDRTGTFTALISCKGGGEVNQTVQFTVSEISGGIRQILPERIYSGDLVDVIYRVEKNNVSMSSGVNFSLYLNGQETAAKSVIFDTSKGWIIRLEAPSSVGGYNISAVAKLDRTSITSTSGFQVRNPVEFVVTSIDRTSVTAGDNVTMVLTATNKGSPIIPDNVLTYIGNSEVPREVANDGRNLIVKITAPSIQPKSYTLRADWNYNGYTYQAAKPLDYVVPVSGSIVDNGRAVFTEIRFLKDGNEKLKMITDSSGRYSGVLVPDTYDAELKFPAATLTMKSVKADSIKDAFTYSSGDTQVPGIKNGIVHFFSTSLPFSNAVIEIPYREDQLDESTLKVFRCSSWNVADRQCRSDWIEINAIIDTSRNIVKIDAESLGAFALGSKEKISVSFNIEKKSYTVRDVVRIRGVTQDFSKAPVPNAKIAVRLGSSEVGNLASDSNGVFSIEFLSPDVEGNNTITVFAEKQPYIRGEATSSFEVKKLRSVSLLFTDSVKATPGKNVTKEIIIINIGQDDLAAKISLTGMPFEYQFDRTEIDLPVNAQERVNVRFVVPEDADEGTYTGTLRVFSDQFAREKQFGFTVETEKAPATSTGFAFAPSFALPALPALEMGGFVYLAIIAAVSFTSAVLLKRFRRRHDNNRMGMLFDIKNHIKSRDRRRKT